MSRQNLSALAAIVLLFLAAHARAAGADSPLILISLDGFRHDYCEKYPEESRTLREMRAGGASVVVAVGAEAEAGWYRRRAGPANLGRRRPCRRCRLRRPKPTRRPCRTCRPCALADPSRRP